MLAGPQSLAIAAIKGVGELINSAGSIADIASKLDDALNLTEKAKKNAPAKPIGKTQKNIQQKLDKYDNTDGESTNLGAIVQQYSDEKKMQNELYLLGCSLNRKFGEGTWDKILPRNQQHNLRTNLILHVDPGLFYLLNTFRVPIP